MRKSIFSIVGALVAAALTVQAASAAPHPTGKAARAPAYATQQFRDAFGSTIEPARSKSCDMLWCYEN